MFLLLNKHLESIPFFSFEFYLELCMEVGFVLIHKVKRGHYRELNSFPCTGCSCWIHVLECCSQVLMVLIRKFLTRHISLSCKEEVWFNCRNKNILVFKIAFEGEVLFYFQVSYPPVLRLSFLPCTVAAIVCHVTYVYMAAQLLLAPLQCRKEHRSKILSSFICFQCFPTRSIVCLLVTVVLPLPALA